jgi:hypothetical protein
LKDLRKWLNGIQGNNNNSNNSDHHNQEIKLNYERFAIFRDKPFWIIDIKHPKLEYIINSYKDD